MAFIFNPPEKPLGSGEIINNTSLNCRKRSREQIDDETEDVFINNDPPHKKQRISDDNEDSSDGMDAFLNSCNTFEDGENNNMDQDDLEYTCGHCKKLYISATDGDIDYQDNKWCCNDCLREKLNAFYASCRENNRNHRQFDDDITPPISMEVSNNDKLNKTSKDDNMFMIDASFLNLCGPKDRVDIDVQIINNNSKIISKRPWGLHHLSTTENEISFRIKKVGTRQTRKPKGDKHKKFVEIFQVHENGTYHLITKCNIRNTGFQCTAKDISFYTNHQYNGSFMFFGLIHYINNKQQPTLKKYANFEALKSAIKSNGDLFKQYELTEPILVPIRCTQPINSGLI